METGNGPVTIRTPFGLGAEEWAEGLEKYAKNTKNLMVLTITTSTNK
jgi:hypothetical protein